MMKDADLSVYDKISRIVLFGNDPSPVAYSVKSITLADKGFLRRKAYPLSARPHGKFYVLFELGNELNVDGVLSEDGAEVCVYTSRWVGVIDKTFFGKKKYPSENRAVVRTFNQLKPYYQRWSAAVAFTPTQLDFIRSLGVDTSKDVPFPRPEEKDAKFTFIDLFAGIGGFRLAMQEFGGRCVFSSEWDVAAQETYAKNYGEKPYGDITKGSTKAAIPAQFDVLCGGFPCQPFSLAGVSARTSLNKKHGFEDKTQGTLFFDIMQIVRRHHPKVLFLENVKNLVSHDEGRTFKIIKESIEAEGYSFNYRVIDASPLVPQKRLRCYMVCVRNDGKFVFPEIKGREKKLSSVLEKEVPDSFTISDGLWAGHQRRTKANLARGTGFTAFTADIDKPSHTLVARYYKDGKECLIPQEGKNPRMLTPRECARLQGFPESFILPTTKSKAYKQMGNSVAVPVLKKIAENIYNQILKK